MKKEPLLEILDLPATPEESFIKLYLKDIGRLWELNAPAQVMFGEFLKLVSYDPKTTIHNVVELSITAKRKIKNLLSNDVNTANVLYSRGLKSLLSSTLVSKLADDLYYISHSICSKTNWSNTEAMKAIKVETIYEAGHRTLITFVEEYPDGVKKSIEYFRSFS
jgi:hypothetical protein